MEFFEDFKIIIINIRQELGLIRSSNGINAIGSTKVGEKLKTDGFKFVYRIQHVQVADTV